MNKNQRIALMLEFISKNFAGMSNQMEEIRKILLEKETVQASFTAPSEYVDKYPLGNAGVGGQNFLISMGEKDTQSPPSIIKPAIQPVPSNWKDEMTEEINKNNAEAVAESQRRIQGQMAGVLPMDKSGLDNSRLCKRILTNKTTIYYKRIQGSLRGTILSVSRKTGQITDHKYLMTKDINHQLALVSHDADGIWYVKNVIRPSLLKRRGSSKIVRYYRPNRNYNYGTGRRPSNKAFTHCAVYYKGD